MLGWGFSTSKRHTLLLFSGQRRRRAQAAFAPPPPFAARASGVPPKTLTRPSTQHLDPPPHPPTHPPGKDDTLPRSAPSRSVLSRSAPSEIGTGRKIGHINALPGGDPTSLFARAWRRLFYDPR